MARKTEKCDAHTYAERIESSIEWPICWYVYTMCTHTRIEYMCWEETHTTAQVHTHRPKQKQIRTHTIRTKYSPSVRWMHNVRAVGRSAKERLQYQNTTILPIDVKYIFRLSFSHLNKDDTIGPLCEQRYETAKSSTSKALLLVSRWNCANQQTKQSKAFQDENLRKQTSNRLRRTHTPKWNCMYAESNNKTIFATQKGNFAWTWTWTVNTIHRRIE